MSDVYFGFWNTLSRPIIGLSPMDGVTDQPYRFIQKKYGNPDVVYTEFTSVEGLGHGAAQLLKDFLYDETQRPVVAQIYGTTPRFFRQAATILCQLGFDGIDINMGCPAKNVAHSGAGAALIRTPELAQEIVRETMAGVTDWVNGATVRDCPDIVNKIRAEVERRHKLLPPVYQERRRVPVSVKTRIGYDNDISTDWVKYLLETQPAVIALHGRTLKQQYGGFANWESIARAAEVIHQTPTLAFGNGDVADAQDARHKATTYGVDGVLIGRASFGNPYVFRNSLPSDSEPTLPQIALEHAQLFEATYQEQPKYTFMPMRKHLGWYVKGIPGAKQLRMQLLLSNSSEEVTTILRREQLI